MKKTILALVLCFAFALNVYGAELNVSNQTLSVTGVMDEDGGHTFAYSAKYEYGIINVGDDIYIDTFSKDGTLKKSYKINITEEKFGGYAYDGTNHYFLFGNDNLTCSSSATIYKLIKYNQSFDKVNTLTFKGSQVYARQVFLGPDNVSDMRVDGEYLFINDVIQEYRYENKYYQSNRSFVINKNTLKCANYIGGIALAKNYKSRDEVSVNMSAVDDGKYYFAVNLTSGIDIFEVDPTDNESTGNHTIKNLATSGLSAYYGDTTMTSSKDRLDVTLKGFEAGDSNFIVVGTETGLNDEDDYGTRIFISTVPKTQVGVINPTTQALTDYGEISNVKVVKLSSNEILLMWQDGERLSYCRLDGGGKLNGEIKKIYGAELGTTTPCYTSDGEIVWAYMVNDDDFAYYKFS